MTPTKQNLFLFFEENEMQSVIDRNLVKLYMNRCIIDEDGIFEISGVYELQKVTDPMYNGSNPLYKTNARLARHCQTLPDIARHCQSKN